MGRLVQKKGFQRLFEARSNNYLTVFVGGGKIPKLMANEKENVLFLGVLSQEKLSEVYQASDVFVLPSDCEGFPLSIQEAMASGLPIVTTKHPGFEKYLDKRYVKFITPTKQAVKTAILEVLTNKSMRKSMIKYSLNTTTVKAGWKSNIKYLLKIYQKVS